MKFLVSLKRPFFFSTSMLSITVKISFTGSLLWELVTALGEGLPYSVLGDARSAIAVVNINYLSDHGIVIYLGHLNYLNSNLFI
jgi:hypothetical protein